jgi:hypothetical protein
MQRLVAYLALFVLLASANAAEQWRSDRFRCSLTFPEGESWVQGTPSPLPAGEMIYVANHSGSKQSIAVIVIPKIPNNDLENPAVISRVMEPIIAMGFQVISNAPVTIEGERFLQLTGRRGETATVSLVCVARAALRENTLYLAITWGRGDEELTGDKHFLRVINTFTLLDPTGPTERVPATALLPQYILTYKVCFIAVGVLLVLGLIVVLVSKPPEFHQTLHR